MDPRQSIDDILDEPIASVGQSHTINKEFLLTNTRIAFIV